MMGLLIPALVLFGVEHHQWKTLIHKIKQMNVSASHHILCSHYDSSECAICSVLQLYENSMLPNHRVLITQSILPPLPFHTFDVWFAPTQWRYRTQGNTHTHTPNRSSSGTLMWQAAVRVPHWCRQRVSHKHAWVNTLSCCCCCCSCCMSPQLHPFI